MPEEINTPANLPEEKSPQRMRFFKIIPILALLILMLGFGYGYHWLAALNETSSQMLVRLSQQETLNQNKISSLEVAVNDLQTEAKKAQALEAQQEKILNEWHAAQKGQLEKWHVAEVQYLVKLANDEIQYSKNTVNAGLMLQRAQQILQNSTETQVESLRKAISDDLANLQKLPQPNINELYQRINAVNRSIDQLPLINITGENKNPETINTEGMSWWRAGLQRTWESLRQIIVVRNIGSNSMPLVLPTEKLFLLQNLHAQLETATWALLHRDVEIYQASLGRTMEWIQLYFDTEATATKEALQALQSLREVNIAAPSLDLTNTLQLLEQYLAQPEPAPKTE